MQDQGRSPKLRIRGWLHPGYFCVCIIFCIGRKYNLDCDPTFAFRSLAAQEQFKGFSSLTPKTQYIISNPTDFFNCGKPLISPSSPLSPHVTFSNTSCSYPLSQVWFSSCRVQHSTCFSGDDEIQDWWRLAKHRKLTVQVLLEESFLLSPRPPLLLLPLRLLKRAMRSLSAVAAAD